MGVLINDKIVTVHCTIEKPMWELAWWLLGGASLVMLVGDGQLSYVISIRKIIQTCFKRIQYTSCNIFNMDQNKNKKGKQSPCMHKRDCNLPLKSKSGKWYQKYVHSENE